ncbi:MAG: hypothetical protein J4G10_00340 [Alphaproteobacteria bacterium]|nr:hypothetical protein [Alphaproteobacteria bacterium]
MSGKSAVFFCGHGSRDPEARLEFETLMDRLREKLPARPVGYGFLEFAKPDIGEGLEELRRRGAERIAVLPLTLFEGGHALNDIPALLRAFEAANPGLALRYGQAFGIETKLLKIAADRIRKAMEDAAAVQPRETFLLFVARGAREAEVGRQAVEMADRLKAEFGFMAALAAFNGLAEPSVEAGLREAARSGAKCVLVVPYFLFTGKLLKELHAKTKAAAAKNADVAFHVTGHLAGHPLLEEFLLDRVGELAGD